MSPSGCNSWGMDESCLGYSGCTCPSQSYTGTSHILWYTKHQGLHERKVSTDPVLTINLWLRYPIKRHTLVPQGWVDLSITGWDWTYKTAPLFIYKPIKLATYSLFCEFQLFLHRNYKIQNHAVENFFIPLNFSFIGGWITQYKDRSYYGMAIHGNSCTKIGIDSDGPQVMPETRNFDPDPERERLCTEFFRKFLPKVKDVGQFTLTQFLSSKSICSVWGINSEAFIYKTKKW